MGKSTYRAEYFQTYKARRMELKWPKCTACGLKARKLPNVGCIECLARTWSSPEWNRLEDDLIEIHAGRDGATHLQYRLYYESGIPRTRGAVSQRIKVLGIRVTDHQDGYTLAQLAELTGRSYYTIRSLVDEGVITNIARGHRILVSTEDGEKVIARYTDPGIPSYSLKEAMKVLGCSEVSVRKAIKRGLPTWKVGNIRRVCKATIDRAVSYLKETGETRVPWCLIVKR